MAKNTFFFWRGCDCRERFNRKEYEDYEDRQDLCLYFYHAKKWTTSCSKPDCECRSLPSIRHCGIVDVDGLCAKEDLLPLSQFKILNPKTLGLADFRVKVMHQQNTYSPFWEIERKKLQIGIGRFDLEIHYLTKKCKEMINDRSETFDEERLAKFTCKLKSKMIYNFFVPLCLELRMDQPEQIED